MNKLFAAALVFLPLQTSAHAQVAHTFVAAAGDDLNSCSRATPCRTFAGAIAKTAAGGVISVVDTAGYGGLTIAKSLSIVSEGTQATIMTGPGDGIVINAGPNDEINLQGLSLQATPNVTGSPRGIVVNSGGIVSISKCTIRGHHNSSGISLASATATKIFVSDCDIAQNSIGIGATQAAGDNLVVLDRVRLVGNDTGVSSDSTKAIFRLSNSTLAQNGVAIGKVQGKILSALNNAFQANGSNGQGMGKEPLR